MLVPTHRCPLLTHSLTRARTHFTHLCCALFRLQPAVRQRYVNPVFRPALNAPPLWLRASYQVQAVHVWWELYGHRDPESPPAALVQRRLLREALAARASVQAELDLAAVKGAELHAA